MKQIAALSAVFSLFVVGVLVGTFGTHLYYANTLQQHDRPPRHLGGHQRFEQLIEDRLELTSEQRTQVDLILERRHQRSEELRREMEPRLREFMQSTAAEIEEILTTEQRAQWRQLRRSEKHRIEKFLLRRDDRGRPMRRQSRRHPPPEDAPIRRVPNQP